MSSKSEGKYSFTVARVVLGLIVFVHGLANSFGLFGGPGVHKLAADIATYVSTSPELLAALIAYGQVVFGLALLCGVINRTASLFVLTVVVLAILGGGRYQKFYVRDDGCEYLLAVAALSFIVAVHGPGALCLDLKKLWPKKKEPAVAKSESISAKPGTAKPGA
jgi:putative oxidoreductase